MSYIYKYNMELAPALPIVEQAYTALQDVSVLSDAEDC